VLPDLAKENIPVCFTSYSEQEARNDLILFKSLVPKLNVVTGPRMNRFSSMIPRIDPGVELDVFYFNNYYVTMVQGVSD
jgi:hypothetical protein